MYVDYRFLSSNRSDILTVNLSFIGSMVDHEFATFGVIDEFNDLSWVPVVRFPVMSVENLYSSLM